MCGGGGEGFTTGETDKKRGGVLNPACEKISYLLTADPRGIWLRSPFENMVDVINYIRQICHFITVSIHKTNQRLFGSAFKDYINFSNYIREIVHTIYIHIPRLIDAQRHSHHIILHIIFICKIWFWVATLKATTGTTVACRRLLTADRTKSTPIIQIILNHSRNLIGISPYPHDSRADFGILADTGVIGCLYTIKRVSPSHHIRAVTHTRRV